MRQTGDENTSSGEAANELTLALRLMYDCNYFLKSRTVLNTVIEEMGLDMTYGELNSRVTTANPTNTRVLEITVEAESPELAKEIVDKICDIGPQKIEEAMGFGQVNLYEYGTLPKTPCNSPGIMKYAVAGIAAAVVVYAVFLLMFLLDDRIRTEEEIERYLGLSVLAEIPDLNGSNRGRYSYYTAEKGKNSKKQEAPEKKNAVGKKG
jgi:capsular polysaccharide biosynthesis protein